MRTTIAAAAVLAALLAGCGEDARGDNAVEAAEHNTVELAGVRYDVVSFRELNVSVAPDDVAWEGQPPRPGHGLYMAVIRACGGADGFARSSADIHLEDAFGQRFSPRSPSTSNVFEYKATGLEPGECRPGEGTAAERTFGGGILVFEVPFDAVQRRPMILEINTAADEARVQLDL